MSGYRSLHREQVNESGCPIWQVQSTFFSNHFVWTASGDGCVRAYRVQEKSQEDDDELNASALTLTQTHALVGSSQVYPPATTLLGCSQVSVGRNYVGQDDMAGDIVVVSLDLTGRVRVWTFSPDELEEEVVDTPKRMTATHEFTVEGATGTVMKYCSPKAHETVTVAVACLEGSIAVVSTGLATPSATKDASPAGTVLKKWTSGATSIAMSLTWHPTQQVLVVGRKDGVVDVLTENGGTHRLLRHSTAVRAVAYTPDAQLLITTSDEGLINVWDINRKSPTLVHHVVQAHDSWILSVSPLEDSRRFVTCGADHKIHVWNVGQIYAPLHTFATDHTVWTTHVQRERLVSGSENGWLQIYSLEG